MAQAEQQSARNAAIAALAAQQLAQLWPQVDWSSPDAVTAVQTVYRAIVTKYGQAAASVAARFYDDTRTQAGVRGQFRATPADPIPQAVLDRVVQSAFLGNPAVDTAGKPALDTTSDLPVEERVPARLDNAVQRHVIQPSRDTIVENAGRDPAKPRWVRVPQGPNPCAFCIMLASRDEARVMGKTIDMTYTSKKSASIREDGHKYHNNCHCEPVMIFPGQTVDEVSPKIADYQDMYYKATAEAGTSRDVKKILAAMRSIHGLR